MAYERTLIQIQERRFLDVLDLALVVVRDRPVALGLTALAGIAPFAAFDAWLLRNREFPAGLLPALLLLQAPWATAPLTVVLGGLMFGERPTIRRVLRTLRRSFWPLLFYQTIVKAAALLPIFSYFVYPTKLAFLNEVVLLEQGRLRGVIARCSQLSREEEAPLLGRWLAELAFGVAFVLAFWAGTGALYQSLVTSQSTWEWNANDLLDARFQVGVWLAVAFFGVVRFFSYIDQRIRLEGWEVELRLRAEGRVLEDSTRW